MCTSEYIPVATSTILSTNLLYEYIIATLSIYRIEQNFGEFGESPQFAKFFSPTFPMKHENAGKAWIHQSFFRQCFKITISPKLFTAKVLFYTVVDEIYEHCSIG